VSDSTLSTDMIRSYTCMHACTDFSAGSSVNGSVFKFVSNMQLSARAVQ